MRTFRNGLFAFCAALATTGTFAHHSEGSTYTRGQRIEWEGTVTFVSWDGAHVMYRLDVKNAAGVVQSWQILGGSPYRLASRGIYKGTVRVGDRVQVAGFLNPYSNIVTPVYFAPVNGAKLFVGYASDDSALMRAR